MNKITHLKTIDRDSKIKILILVWIIAALFFNEYESAMRFRFLINIRPDRIIFVSIFLFFFIDVLLNKRSVLNIKSIEIMMIILVIVCSISLIVSKSNLDISRGENRWLSTLFTFLIIPFCLFYISKNLNYEKKDMHILFFVLTFIGFYLGLIGIFEHYQLNSLIFPKYILNPNLGLHFGRARGPFLDSGSYGKFLTFCFFCSFILISRSKGFKKVFFLIITITMLVGVYFSYTRGTWVGLAFGLLIILFVRSNIRRIALILIFCFLISSFFGLTSKLAFLEDSNLFTKRQDTISQRKNLLFISLKMIEKKPFFGWGYGRFIFENVNFFKKYFDDPSSGVGEGNHNTPIGLFVEVGLLGFFPYIFIIYKLINYSIKLYYKILKNNIFKIEFLIIYWAVFSTYLVSMQFGDIRFNQLVNGFVFIFSGIVVGSFEKIKLTTKTNKNFLD